MNFRPEKIDTLLGVLGAIFTVLITSISVGIYVSRIESKADEALKSLSESKEDTARVQDTLDVTIREMMRDVKSIDQRLSQIEGTLKKWR